jgi:hypothetical protein
MPLIPEDKIIATIKNIRKRSFPILDFIETFKPLYPEEII